MLTLFPLLLAAASPAPSMAGAWDLKSGEQTIFRLDIRETASGTTATWERPEHLQMDGDSFSHLSGPAIRRIARNVRSVDGDIELTFDDPAPGATPDILRLHRVDMDHVDVTYEGTPFEPFGFVRTKANAAPLGPWDVNRRYIRATNRPT